MVATRVESGPAVVEGAVRAELGPAVVGVLAWVGPVAAAQLDQVPSRLPLGVSRTIDRSWNDRMHIGSYLPYCCKWRAGSLNRFING